MYASWVYLILYRCYVHVAAPRDITVSGFFPEFYAVASALDLPVIKTITKNEGIMW